MFTQDQPFLEADASLRYNGLRTRPIRVYRFVPWATIAKRLALWLGTAGIVAVAAVYALARFAG